MRIILDTSIIIAWLLTKKVPYLEEIFNQTDKKTITICASSETLRELKETIQKEHIKKHLKAHQVANFINKYQHTVMVFDLSNTNITIENRDPNDIIFLKIAVVAKAQYILSYDKDLLEIQKVGYTKIVKPKDFKK